MRHSSHMTPDPNGFKTSIENIMKRHMTNKMGLKNVNLTAVMKEFYSALIHYKVQQDSAFINVVLSVLLIEGLGRNLDVKDDILQDIIPYLR
ncbi:ABC1 family protein C21C3.03, mitochondrial-like [Fopius arisanus]|nr:PREDICTED: ABC1 family protein C21C3.03, mitochondrial-like [Fopius arisanus]